MSTIYSNLIFFTNILSIIPLYLVAFQKILKKYKLILSNKLQKEQLQLKQNTILFSSYENKKQEPILDKLRKDHSAMIDKYCQEMNRKQYIWSNRENREISSNELLLRLSGKHDKLILVTPGGLYGYYMLGIVRYLSLNYDLGNYIFTGSSAGSWCCLILSLKDKKKINILLMEWLQGVNKVLCDSSLYEFIFYMKKRILELTTDSDYDLDRMYIGVLKYENYELKTTIYCNFNNLEDALNCCIASSNIPFLTGEFNHTYQGNISFDGIFSKYPYINIMKTTMIIHPNIWNTPNLKRFGMSLLNKQKVNIWNLCIDGYNDTLINNEIVEELFGTSNSMNNGVKKIHSA